MPLVINNVRGEHTHTHKHTCILDNSNFNKLGMCCPVAGTCLFKISSDRKN